MRKKYQSKERKSIPKFEVVAGQELQVQVPLPMAEVWAEMQAQVEDLAGQAGLQILRLESRRVFQIFFSGGHAQDFCSGGQLCGNVTSGFSGDRDRIRLNVFDYADGFGDLCGGGGGRGFVLRERVGGGR